MPSAKRPDESPAPLSPFKAGQRDAEYLKARVPVTPEDARRYVQVTGGPLSQQHLEDLFGRFRDLLAQATAAESIGAEFRQAKP